MKWSSIDIEYNEKKYRYEVKYDDTFKKMDIKIFSLIKGEIGYRQKYLKRTSCSRFFVSRKKIEKVVIKEIKKDIKREAKKEKMINKSLQ